MYGFACLIMHKFCKCLCEYLCIYPCERECGGHLCMNAHICMHMSVCVCVCVLKHISITVLPSAYLLRIYAFKHLVLLFVRRYGKEQLTAATNSARLSSRPPGIINTFMLSLLAFSNTTCRPSCHDHANTPMTRLITCELHL